MNRLQITLTVVFGLLTLIALIAFFGRATVRLVSHGNLKVTLRVFCFRKTLVDEGANSGDDQNLRPCKNPKRALRRERRRLRKLERQAEKERQRAEKKQQKKAPSEPTPNWLDNLKMITSLVQVLHEKTGGRILVQINRLYVRVASPNAARTAILYGVAVQATSYLLTWINGHFVRVRQAGDGLKVYSDFSANTPSADVDISCSLPIWRALDVGVAILKAYKEERQIALQSAKDRLEKTPDN